MTLDREITKEILQGTNRQVQRHSASPVIDQMQKEPRFPGQTRQGVKEQAT